jgi:hypothetical protein
VDKIFEKFISGYGPIPRVCESIIGGMGILVLKRKPWCFPKPVYA